MSYKNLLVTGGAGFIGANFIHYLFEKSNFAGTVVNLDKLSYAGNLETLEKIDKEFGGKRYFFERTDICDFKALEELFKKYEIDCVCHFAAESHVDRSIFGPKDFIETNIVGTFNLLEVTRECWKGRSDVRFHHVSTDEVYGSLGDTGHFYEDTPYDPRSPYSSSKASSDHLVRAYFHTYGLPVSISNCSNNYGPYQFPEKLIPVVILNALAGKSLPIYGDGKNIRDWLYVEDHCSAIAKIVFEGNVGETYNVGGECELMNIDLVHKICEILDTLRPKEQGRYKDLITFVKDRPGHDRRYAINCDKIKKNLGWTQSVTFEQGITNTIQWYLDNMEWVEHIQSGEYMEWIEKNYGDR